MKLDEKNKISVTFYLKEAPTLLFPQKKSVYACISFKGESNKFSTGLHCKNPKEHWFKGCFTGIEFSEENGKLSKIKKEIEGYNHTMFRDVKEIKNLYDGIDVQEYPITILKAFDYGIEIKKRTLSEGTMDNYYASLKSFEKFLLEYSHDDFGVVKNHPRKLNKLRVKAFVTYLENQGLRKGTIHNRIVGFAALFNIYEQDHSDILENIIPNPFKNVVPNLSANERVIQVEKALARDFDWKYVEKIEYLKHECKSGGSGSGLGQADTTKDEQYRLVALLIAYSGLSFVDLGKPDVLEITKRIDGEALISRRQKTKSEYTIPITPPLKSLIEKLKDNMPWKPFVFDSIIKDRSLYKYYKQKFYVYLQRLAKEIEFEEGKLTSHRFRHTFGMRAVNHYKIEIRWVAKMLGDKEDTVIKNYTDYNTDTIMSGVFASMNAFNSSDNKSQINL